MRLSECAKQFAAENGCFGLVGRSARMQHVYDAIAAVADTSATVMVRGESGTGKELVARAIHRESRGRQNFVAINCAAIPDGLLESELFGHARGAYTGALNARVGKFEEAHGGTILLDEIGEMATPTQARILRVLQEKEITPLGRNRTMPVDVRVIAATNSDLEEKVSRSSFRADLYYRLMVFPIAMPALRERKEDIATLAEFFIHKYNGELGLRVDGITKRALEFLSSEYWKGNVRELEGVVYRAMVWKRHLSHKIAKGNSGNIDLQDIQNPCQVATNEVARASQEETFANFWQAVARPYTERLITRTMVRQTVRRALDRAGGNYREVVRLFGLPATDYKRFMDFLRRHDCSVDFRAYRHKDEHA